MSKTKTTIELQDALINDTRQKRIYGCEEVTIGFQNSGRGHEVADFMTMDSKGILRCYELKVTLQDLKSRAKKSWYGHYNYLVVNDKLYKKIEDWTLFVPEGVGILCGTSLSCRKKPSRKNIPQETETMLKESLIRSLYWKIEKYRDAANLEKKTELEKKIRELEKEKNSAIDRAWHAEHIIHTYEKYKMLNDGLDDVSLELLGQREKEKWHRNISAGKNKHR